MTLLSFLTDAPGAPSRRVVLVGSKTRIIADSGLGDTNFELGQPAVDPRRERMDEPQFLTDDARVRETVPTQSTKSSALFRRALVEQHTTPDGAPREELRSHLDEGIKDQLKADVGAAGPDTDPDLKREGRPIGGHRGSAKEDDTLLEALAALMHQQWTEWSKNLAKSEDLSPEREDRWEDCWIAYSKLPEGEKDKDRLQARKIVKLLKSRGIKLAFRTQVAP